MHGFWIWLNGTSRPPRVLRDTAQGFCALASDTPQPPCGRASPFWATLSSIVALTVRWPGCAVSASAQPAADCSPSLAANGLKQLQAPQSAGPETFRNASSGPRNGYTWLTHLLAAGRVDGAPGFMKAQAVLIPIQPAERHQFAYPALRIGHCFFITKLEHGQAERLAPELHQAPILPVIFAEVAQVVGVGVKGVEMLRINGKTGIERMAHAVNDVGIGKQKFDQAQVQVIVRHLIGDARRI